MMAERERSFFWTLAQRAGTQNRENQLSSTFAACFTQSPWFRNVIIEELSRACRIDKPLGVSSWACSEQNHLPKGGRDRIDLLLSPSPPRKGVLPFHLESKVESPLTEEQVKKYRKKGATYLVVVTKHPPEVSERRLRQLGAHAVRWQEIHRALLASKPTGPIDRFIRSTFVTFLEELRMAHETALTFADVRRIQQTLKNIRSDRRMNFTPKDMFQQTDALLDFLAEVKRQFIERNLAMENYYYRGRTALNLYFEDKNFRKFVFYWKLRKRSGRKRSIACYIALPMDSSAVVLGVEDDHKGAKDYHYEWPLKQFCTKGVLSVEKCVAHLTRVSKKRHIV